ncbi:hypothetical protein [Mycolicibacterium neworleansense]|uniref:ATP-dependent transcriptional regulator n=1 Tax=Mycolicibacterium neworleansense TaxID=146018 RepID=A0A0H5S472_9MYCO|nr:hypothetical protein [Mycolicibacterium neworleansense]CRZ15924.1 hypothetical protein BN2156_02788 [Mycolicibacterium neworleansense]
MTAIAAATAALADAAFGGDPQGGSSRFACRPRFSPLSPCRSAPPRGPPVPPPGLPGAYEAAADALVGLAADALGMGRFGVSARLLERARAIATPEGSRQAIRLSWVSAELAMVQGHGATAVEHARRGVDAAAGHPSTRHAVKSDVVLAAALCSAGDIDAAREVADAALLATEKSGLIPLRWALACVLSDIGSATHDAAQISEIRDLSADTVRRRGGVWAGA